MLSPATTHSFALLENTSKSKVGLRCRYMRWKGDAPAKCRNGHKGGTGRDLLEPLQDNQVAGSFLFRTGIMRSQTSTKCKPHGHFGAGALHNPVLRIMRIMWSST
jgi:hypothetical protein